MSVKEPDPLIERIEGWRLPGYGPPPPACPAVRPCPPEKKERLNG